MRIKKNYQINIGESISRYVLTVEVKCQRKKTAKKVEIVEIIWQNTCCVTLKIKKKDIILVILVEYMFTKVYLLYLSFCRFFIFFIPRIIII